MTESHFTRSRSLSLSLCLSVSLNLSRFLCFYIFLLFFSLYLALSCYLTVSIFLFSSLCIVSLSLSLSFSRYFISLCTQIYLYTSIPLTRFLFLNLPFFFTSHYVLSRFLTTLFRVSISGGVTGSEERKPYV